MYKEHRREQLSVGESMKMMVVVLIRRMKLIVVVLLMYQKKKSVQTQTDLTQFDMAHSERDLTYKTVAMYTVRVTIPSFTGGKKQLPGIDVEQTRITNIRIHVEQVIGLLQQKYSILSDTQQIDVVLYIKTTVYLSRQNL